MSRHTSLWDGICSYILLADERRPGWPNVAVSCCVVPLPVNQEGRRFTDEAPGTVDAYYERVTRRIFDQANGIAYVLLDASYMDIPNYRLGLRTDQPPTEAPTVHELATNVFTFGGLKVDRNARVIDINGDPIRGLYAAGEIIGSYYGNYTGATSVLKGAVFGRLAGIHAAQLSKGQ